MIQTIFFSKRLFSSFVVILICLWLFSCASNFPKPDEIIAPRPKLDNSGLYMCPYTQDGVVAEWVDRAINARMGSAIGGQAGAYAGQQATSTVSGGQLGSLVGSSIGRSIAIKASGGEEYIKKTSDISFNNMNDLAIYMYAKFSQHEHYGAVLDLTMAIYPQLYDRYFNAIKMARKKK
jgi:hypothetical protein